MPTMGLLVAKLILVAWLAAAPRGGPGSAPDASLAALARARIVLLVWAGGAATLRVDADRFSGMSPIQLEVFLAGLAGRLPDPTERLVAVSSMFLDTPYVKSPLGEGAGHPPDPDPLIRFDGVDCTTFVEQTMALARARSLTGALAWLRRIRYLHGRMDFRARKHFMMAQWIPANQQEGFCEDITERVAGRRTVWIAKRLDAEAWRRRENPGKWPELEPDDVPAGVFRLPIVPLSQVMALSGRIPMGTLVNVVRRDLRAFPARVTHQGILVACSDGRCLRHAGRAGYGRVKDEPLEHFVRRNLAYRKWPVTGFNLQRLILPGIRSVISK